MSDKYRTASLGRQALQRSRVSTRSSSTPAPHLRRPSDFPVRLMVEWPDAALAEIGLDAYTAVACLTHDAKIDDVALALALRAPCAYIGVLGSSNKHRRRLERPAKSGFDVDISETFL